MAFPILNMFYIYIYACVCVVCVLTEGFSIFKINKCERQWHIGYQNMSFPYLVMDLYSGMYLPSNTALPSPANSALARVLIYSQRNIIEVTYVHRSSYSLLPSIELNINLSATKLQLWRQRHCPKGWWRSMTERTWIHGVKEKLDGDKCYEEKAE